MREIHKKISPEYFEAIASGQKTFEYRLNDFVCEPGDVLVLDEYEYPNGQGTLEGRYPTGRFLRKTVGYVAHTTDFDWLGRPDVKVDFEKYGAQIISLVDEKTPKVHIIVGGILERDGKYLLVQEAQVSCRGKWNVPAGHLDAEELLVDGMKREVREECGFAVEPTGICQIGNRFLMPDCTFASIIFTTKIKSGEIKYDPEEILDVKWFSYDEILAMQAELRNPPLIIDAIENIRTGKVATLDLISNYDEVL